MQLADRQSAAGGAHSSQLPLRCADVTAVPLPVPLQPQRHQSRAFSPGHQTHALSPHSSPSPPHSQVGMLAISTLLMMIMSEAFLAAISSPLAVSERHNAVPGACGAVAAQCVLSSSSLACMPAAFTPNPLARPHSSPWLRGSQRTPCQK